MASLKFCPQSLGEASMFTSIPDKGYSSKTVLHLSVFKGYTEITRLLLGDIESPSTSCSNIRIEELQVISQSYC